MTVKIENLVATTKRQFSQAQRDFDSKVQSHQLMCRIFDKFSADDEKHNCLGCNFDDLTSQISKFLKVAAMNPVSFDLHHLFSMYASIINSGWERISDIFGIISIPEGYRCRHFSPFIRARRWSNFFKHPKTFGWVVHHPVYTIDGSDHHKSLSADAGKYRFVEDEFLKKYYSSDCEKNVSKLRGEFVGHEHSTVVVLPDIVQLTVDICNCLDHFVKVITENPVYVEMLDDTSTIADYYSRIQCVVDDTGGVP